MWPVHVCACMCAFLCVCEFHVCVRVCVSVPGTKLEREFLCSPPSFAQLTLVSLPCDMRSLTKDVCSFIPLCLPDQGPLPQRCLRLTGLAGPFMVCN